MLHHMAGDIAKRRFTAAEYQLMGRAGILSHDDRVELIDGEIIEMTPVGTGHTSAVMRAARALTLAVSERGPGETLSPGSGPDLRVATDDLLNVSGSV